MLILEEAPDHDPDRDSFSTKYTNTYVLNRLAQYTTARRDELPYGEELLEEFAVDFNKWTGKTFRRVDRDLRLALQNLLRKRGIFVKKNIAADKALKALIEHTANSEGLPQ